MGILLIQRVAGHMVVGPFFNKRGGSSIIIEFDVEKERKSYKSTKSKKGFDEVRKAPSRCKEKSLTVVDAPAGK